MLIRTYQRRRGGRSSQSDDGSQESHWSSQESAPVGLYSSQESGWSQTEELEFGKPERSQSDRGDLFFSSSQSDEEDGEGVPQERSVSLGLAPSAAAASLMPPPANRHSKNREARMAIAGAGVQSKPGLYRSHSAPSSPSQSQAKKRKQTNGPSPRKVLKAHPGTNGISSSKSKKVLLLAGNRTGFRSGSGWKGISVPAVAPSSTLMEAQESGEMIEHVDEANFALDGLKAGQPVRVLRASLATMAQLCGSAERRRLLRNQGMARTLLEAVVALPVEDPALALAAAAVLFFLASDGTDDELLESEKCISFVLNLLEHPGMPAGKPGPAPGRPRSSGAGAASGVGSAASQRAAAAVEAKVRALFTAGSEHGGERDGQEAGQAGAEDRCQHPGVAVAGAIEAQDVSPRWLALLTLEHACSSAVLLDDSSGGGTGGKAGRFKERLREQGGLDAVCQLASLCVAEMQESLEEERASGSGECAGGAGKTAGPAMLLRCLRVMENVTFLSEANQRHLIEMQLKAGAHGRLPQPFLMLLLDSIKTLTALEAVCNQQLTPGSKRPQDLDDKSLRESNARTCGGHVGNGAPAGVGKNVPTGRKAGQLFGGAVLQRAFEKTCGGGLAREEGLGAALHQSRADSGLENEDMQLEEELDGRGPSTSFRLFNRSNKKAENGGSEERSAGAKSGKGVLWNGSRLGGTAGGSTGAEPCRVGMEMEFEFRVEQNESQEVDSDESRPASQPSTGKPPLWASKDSRQSAILAAPFSRTANVGEQQSHWGKNKTSRPASSAPLADATCQPGKGMGKPNRLTKREDSVGHVAHSEAKGKSKVGRADSAPLVVTSVFDFDEAGLTSAGGTGVTSWGPPALGMELSEEVARRLTGEGLPKPAEPITGVDDVARSEMQIDLRPSDLRLGTRRKDRATSQGDDCEKKKRKARDRAKAQQAVIVECLVSAVKVLMNVTNENAAGCRLVAASGGLHTISALAMSRCRHLSVVAAATSDTEAKPQMALVLAGKENARAGSRWRAKESREDEDEMCAEDVDLLMVALGVLVNLVEKDESIRAQLAQLECWLTSAPREGAEAEREENPVGMLPFLCALFLSKQGAGEAAMAAEEKAQMEALDAAEELEAGQREAEAMMVEAYAALLLAFLSQESERAQEAIAQLLPGGHLGALVPVLEHFIAFHQSLNTITPESHAAVQALIAACRPAST